MRRLLFIALLALACHRHESLPTEPDCRPVMGALGDAYVHGLVYIGKKQPVVNARVRFVRDGQDATYGGRTDANGSFYAYEMWRGGYTYTVTLADQTAPYMSGHTILQCGENTMTISLAAEPCVFIAGTLKDGYFYVSGATVSFLDKMTTSDYYGSYALNLGCPPMNIGRQGVLTVQHPKYQTITMPLPVPSSSMTINFELTNASRGSGSVRGD